MRTPDEIKKGLECYIVQNTGGCENIPCRDCSHYNPNSAYTITACKDALACIQQLEAAQPKWISVEDELPKRWRENDKEQTLINYQIYSPEYGVDVGNYLKPAGVWVIMGLPVKVTHWMPLPEPPKEDA